MTRSPARRTSAGVSTKIRRAMRAPSGARGSFPRPTTRPKRFPGIGCGIGGSGERCRQRSPMSLASVGIVSAGSSPRSSSTRHSRIFVTWAGGRNRRQCSSATSALTRPRCVRPSRGGSSSQQSGSSPPIDTPIDTPSPFRPMKKPHSAANTKRGNQFELWAWVELNYRPHAYQACALTT
jgi:hypothetical protein